MRKDRVIVTIVIFLFLLAWEAVPICAADSAKAEEYIKQGIGYGKVGKHQEALVAFKEAVRVQPDNVLAPLPHGNSVWPPWRL